jgi:cyclohexa-1,5-dienecarbonyl-CoA hydratase
MTAGGEPIRVDLDRQGGTALITMSRPPLNILDISSFRILHSLLEDAVSRQKASVVVIQSAIPGTFSAGADVADHVPERVREMLEAFHRIAEFLSRMEAVSVAAVNGLALGGGCELALCCDIVLASDKATFGQPEIDVGCFPPIAAAILPGRIGLARAADLVLTGRRIDATEAMEMGLVSRLLPSTGFNAGLRSFLAELQGKSSRVLGITAKILREGGNAGFGAELRRTEKGYLDKLLSLQDSREGVMAFMEKRSPKWSGT